MPNISAHLIVAKEVSRKLNINSNDYIQGNVLPDVLNKEDSHHKIKGSMYMIPDTNYFVKTLDLNNNFDLGYLTHVLLDKHYLEDYICKLYPNKDVFKDKKIYEDYNYLNYSLIKKFGLDVNYLESILNTFNCKIDKEKLKYNIEYLKQKKSGKTIYLDLESFSSFLKEVSNTISKELIKYANKSS